MSELRYTHIFLPVRPQVDTIIAIFLLKTFGEGHFPGVQGSQLAFLQSLPEGTTSKSLQAEGKLCVDIGGGAFDHHTAPSQTTASDLIAEYLGVHDIPAIQKLLEFARRDDFFGKGIVSADALDRAFGLPGLIANLNKKHSKEPHQVVAVVIPLFEAHYEEEVQRTEGLPKAFKELVDQGMVQTLQVRQGDKKLSVVILASDNGSFAGYLRSQLGGRHDVVAQWLSSGHVNILTRPTKRVRLKSLVALLRLEEAQRAIPAIILRTADLGRPGKITEVPQWYYDPATNSIQNGGLNPQGTLATKIEREEFLKVIELGLSEVMPGLPR